MGCTQSRIENEEALTRCRERKQLMKDALSSRNAFAAAHSAYTIALKNTGAALSDYAHGESLLSSSSSSSSDAAASSTAAVHPPIETLPPPPPPLPDLSPPPLQRAATMPDLPVPKPNKNPPAADVIREEEEEDGADLPASSSSAAAAAGPASSSSPPPPPMPESKGMEATWDYFFGMGENMPAPSLIQPEESPQEINETEKDKSKKADVQSTAGGDDPPPVIPEAPPPKPAKKPKQDGSDGKGGKMVPAAARKVSLLQVLNELDEHFLKAYESAHEVSKMLEATRMHYHSNFADNRGHIDHSARVMRVITWNKSLKGIPNADDGKDDYDSAQWETHATVLDKMVAWEKKLYDDVKAGGLIKLEYQRKLALLNKQRKHGVNPEVLEKTKSAVSHLHTRFIIDIQSMDSTVSEINRLRDDRLYSKLLDLVDGMAKMWETMHANHVSQLKIVADLRSIDILLAPKETTKQHHDRTVQLWEVLKEWHLQFQKLMVNQKAYIRALNGWLKLNLIPIETSSREKVSSPTRVLRPPIQALLNAWNDQLEKLSDELARGAIYSFSEVVHTIMLHQEDELKQKEKCEETRKEYMRKVRGFEDWHQKYMQRRTTSSTEEVDPEIGEGASQNDPVVEKKFVVEALKSRLESEMEMYQNLCKQVREKSIGSLRTHLPELFRAMSEFAHVSAKMYKRLRPSIAQSQNPMDN